MKAELDSPTTCCMKAMGQAVAALEAKRSDTPLSGKEQAREYADSLGIEHVFLSNGDLHYHWSTDSCKSISILVAVAVADTILAAFWLFLVKPSWV